MNYAQIVIGGRKVGLKFGLPSYRMFTEKLKVFPQLINADGKTMNEAGFAYVLYFAYINNCMIKDEAPELTFEAFLDYIETAPDVEGRPAEFAAAMQVWAESREVKKLKEEVDGVKKKNGLSTTSSPSVTAPSGSA